MALVAAPLLIPVAARSQDAGLPPDLAAESPPAAGSDLGEAPPLVTVPPSVLPATGYATGEAGGATVRTGDLGRAVAQAYLPPGGGTGVAGPAWQLTPSLGLTEELTDNAQTGAGTSTGSGKRGDLITTLQPSLAVTGDTQRLQVNLAYDPQIYLYARDGSQDRVGQDFNGRALATLVPQTLFLDVRGLATEQSVAGGVTPLGSTTLSRNQTSQAYSFSASPYLVHRFGTTGLGEIGYTIARTAQTATGTPTAVPSFGFGVLPAGAVPANQRTTTQNLHAAFVTGEAFGRYSGTALASATRFDGTGVLSGAHRRIVSLDNGYAVTRTVTVLATIGYEDIRYTGTTPLRVNDALWDVGLRLVPNADSTITVRYGHHDGFDSVTLDGVLAPTPRTRVYVRYSEGLSTNQEELQNALATTDLDALGNPVDALTGAPVFAASNFFGVQDTLSRLRRASLTASYLLDRDTFTAAVESDRYKVLSMANVGVTGAIGSNSGTYGTLSWLHQLSPRLSSTAFVEYGKRSQQGPPASTQDILSLSAALSYALGRTLTSTLQYSHDQSSGGSFGAGGGSTRDNILLLSVVKTF